MSTGAARRNVVLGVSLLSIVVLSLIVSPRYTGYYYGLEREECGYVESVHTVPGIGVKYMRFRGSYIILTSGEAAGLAEDGVESGRPVCFDVIRLNKMWW